MKRLKGAPRGRAPGLHAAMLLKRITGALWVVKRKVIFLATEGEDLSGWGKSRRSL